MKSYKRSYSTRIGFEIFGSVYPIINNNLDGQIKRKNLRVFKDRPKFKRKLDWKLRKRKVSPC